ncbi:MAG TPA: hypothetical protein VMV10_12130 [Pirellulales bacterium]|nr:hypothetical protein [Pirellulales bacterium]
MPTPFLDRFRAILLDMNGTFMFGQDRFGPEGDFAATYRELGGGGLCGAEVERAVRATCEAMPPRQDSASGFAALGGSATNKRRLVRFVFSSVSLRAGRRPHL